MTTPSIDGKTQLPPKERLFTLNYLLICLASFAFFSSMQLLLPTLPLYILAIGGKESDIGIVAGAFTVTALSARPLIGWAVDTGGKKVFMLVGAVIFALASLLYIPINSIPWLLGLRLFHGIGIAAFTTGVIALVADISPIMRRGEAMGYFGLSSNLSMALAPALGIIIMERFGFTPMFLVAAGCAAVALLLSLVVTDHRNTAPHPAAKMSWGSFFSRAALFPSALVLCLTATYGMVVTFLPLYVIRNGMGNPGLFFTIFAAVLVVTRPTAGRLSDILGRKTIILPGMLLVALAMALFAAFPSAVMLAVAGVAYGAGFGAVHPTLLAWVIDRVPPDKRGAATATFTSAFDLGIGTSSVILGFVLEAAGFATMWALAGGVALIGCALALTIKQPKAVAGDTLGGNGGGA